MDIIPWPSDDRPVILCDVDGVWNAFSVSVMDGYQTGMASPSPEDGTYQICWNPEIVADMMDLIDSERVHFTWLTSWGSGANGELRELLGFPNSPVAGESPLLGGSMESQYDAYGRGPDWWKLRVVEKLYAENQTRKYVWIDDELAAEHIAFEWCGRRDNVLAIAPRQHTGLTRRDMLEIREFLDS